MSEPAYYRPNVGDSSAYREALQRATEAATAEGETPETPELEAVPVSASDQPLVPEPEAVEPVVEESAAEETPEEQQQEAPVVEPSIEDLRQQLAAAQARLEEKDSFIGRQSSEVGELRQAITEMQQSLATAKPEPVAQGMAITQDMIDSNPAQAAQLAYAQKNPAALEIAFEAWKLEEPFDAASWRADKLREQQQADFDAKLAEQQKRIDTATAPIAETQAQQQWNEAFNIAKVGRPDFIENAERLLTDVAPEYPELAALLQTGDAKAKATALTSLYALDKMGNPQAVQAQLAEQATEAAAEAAASLHAASAVSGQTTAGQATVEKTVEQLEQEAYAARRDSKPSLSRGWTGRS